MAYDLSEINRRAKSDPKGFIEEFDDAYNQKICEAADRIIEHTKISQIVLLSGPSGSGKTTTALKIEAELNRRGITTHAIGMDNYFKPYAAHKVPLTPDGKPDYESPLCLDTDLLHRHFEMIARGERIFVPKFDFAQQIRIVKPKYSLKMGKDEVAIFEGIHALNDDLAGQHPEAFKLYISAASHVMDGDDICFRGSWMRLIRRTVRDYKFRGASAAETLEMWSNVRRGEELYIEPYRHRADFMFDSSFPYEVSVMKAKALELLTVPEGIARYDELSKIVPALDRFEAIDDSLLLPESLLREFIGGGIYKY